MNDRERIAWIGDVHLEQDDPALPEFLAFLRALGRRVPRIVFMGDLFTIWLGRAELQLPHHRAVLDVCRELRAQGVSLGYVEGNRDYRIERAFVGDAFDDASESGLADRCGTLRVLAVHGHWSNPADRQYRTWHRLSRSAPFWGAFHLLPRASRVRWVEDLERRMRGTNLRFKRAFPEQVVRRYASGFLRDGADAVVLGHFHEEHALRHDDPPGRIFVLPEWKGSRRHLEASRDGTIAFVASDASAG